jgi:ribosomal protein S18 acetylase RimI-like enzyme
MEAIFAKEKHSTTKEFLKKATIKDQSVVVDILCESFKHDPHMNWLLEKSHNPDKLRIIMNYLFWKTLAMGDIYISKDNQAAALWKSEKKQRKTLDLLLMNVKLLYDIGISSIYRILKNERFTYKQYPKQGRFCHLYLIGVLPACQGKGYASKLMNPILNAMHEQSIPVYLETANIRNVQIYRKKGFRTYNTWIKPGIELFYMKKTNAM